jgi:signal transduction histidine kinase
VEEFARRPRDIGDAEPIESVLRRAISDPTLAVVYRITSSDAWIDGDGRSALLPEAQVGRVVRDIRRDGQLIAAVDYSCEVPPGLIGPVLEAASAELDNARLRAELGVQLSEVRASRTRIIAAADAERRRIERNLHDGAQQRLVAVALDLRAARLGTTTDAPVACAIDHAVDDLGRAIKDLRDLANGLHPSILGEEGLVAALRAVADRSPLRVRIDAGPERYQPEVEATAYYVACEALTNAAKHAHATSVDVAVLPRSGTLLVEVRDDGVGGADLAAGSGLRGLVDRVDSVGGQLDVVSPPGGGTTVRVELPCGS